MSIESYWENVSGAKLRQGDYIFNCPVPVFAEQFPEQKSEIEINVDIDFYDLIVVTQSCDLEQNKIRLVAMCPIYQLENYEQFNHEFAKKGRWEEVRKGRIEGLYLLSSPINPENNRECLVVDFRDVEMMKVNKNLQFLPVGLVPKNLFERLLGLILQIQQVYKLDRVLQGRF